MASGTGGAPSVKDAPKNLLGCGTEHLAVCAAPHGWILYCPSPHIPVLAYIWLYVATVA